ncbi:MAG: hypothetical protein LBK07_04920 [Tannerella sp.]|jgi:cell division protein FtsB|nr:hypothetical protein [Tannerella sp.]
MKKILFTAVLILAGAGAFAQTVHPTAAELEKELQTLKTGMQTLQTETRRLKSEINTLQTQLKAASETIESLKLSTQSNSQAISETASQLGIKISTTEATANQRFQEVDRSVSHTTLYVVIVLLLAVLLSVLVFRFLSKRQKTDKSDLVAQLSNAKEEIEKAKAEIEEKKAEIDENLINGFDRMTSLLEELLKGRMDHSLALKVAGEINLIERNISRMAEGTKGLKQLKRSVETLKDNLVANEYSMPVLLGKEYHEGMKVIVINSVLDEDMEKGAEVITKVQTPQVNYRGKMIQAAEIEITVGPPNDDEEDSGSSEDSGTDGNSGSGEDTGTDGNGGSSEDTGTDGNSGSGEDTGTDGNSGNGEDTGTDGNSENAGDDESSEDNQN